MNRPDRRIRRGAGVIGWVAVAARAQVEVCAGSWTATDWREGMDAVDQALAGLDGDLARAVVDDMLAEAYCTGELLPPEVVARFARQAALLAFYGQDQAELQAWGALARDLAPDAPWTLPAPERFHALLAELPPTAVAPVEGAHLAPPKGGAVLVDGRVVLEAAAGVGSAHLVQVADKRGAALTTAFTVGASFPPEALGPEAAELRIPKWYDAPPAAAPAPAPPAPAAAGEVTFDGEAGRCPWDGVPEAVDARRREVRIGEGAYPIRTPAEQAAFRATLRSCGEFRAARRFSRWIGGRGVPFAGAGKDRDAMEQALLTPEPKRKRGKEPRPAP